MIIISYHGISPDGYIISCLMWVIGPGVATMDSLQPRNMVSMLNNEHGTVGDEVGDGDGDEHGMVEINVEQWTWLVMNMKTVRIVT